MLFRDRSISILGLLRVVLIHSHINLYYILLRISGTPWFNIREKLENLFTLFVEKVATCVLSSHESQQDLKIPTARRLLQNSDYSLISMTNYVMLRKLNLINLLCSECYDYFQVF